MSLGFVKKKSFCTNDGISITLNAEDLFEYETYAFSSVFVQRKKCSTYRPKSLLCLLLIICGDVETCPGPVNTTSFLSNLKGMHIYHQNIRGLFTNFTKVQSFFATHKNVDILTLSETHIHSHNFNDNTELYSIPGYTFIKRNRINGSHGGVAMYISEKITWKRRQDLEKPEVEFMVIEIIQNKAKNFLVCTLYRPPESSEYLHKNFNNIFADILTLINTTCLESIILGDLNADYLKRSCCKHLKDIIRLQGYKQLIKSPTRVTSESSTLIDVILTNNEHVISATDTSPLNLSDHDLVGCVRKINFQKFESRTITCRNYTNYNKNKMVEDLKSKNIDAIYAIHDVNQAWRFLKSILSRVFDNHAPKITKRIKGRHCPWLTTDVKQQINRKDQLLRKARKSKLPADWNMYKTARNHCNYIVRTAKKAYHHDLLKENRHKPRNFWKCVKAVFPSGQGKSETIFKPYDADINNEKANTFCSFFSNVAAELKNRSLPLINCTWRFMSRTDSKTDKVFHFEYVSKIFIEKELKSLKRHKATGFDDLPSNLLKDSSCVVSGPLAHIINLSLKSGVVPSEWKTAIITPLHKSGDKDSADNYRPISVLPVLSKILEKAVHKQLTDFLENNKLLSDKQFGYRKGRSTELATTLFLDDVRKAADNGKLTGAVFIDLSKAFDTLGHTSILVKLQSYGIKDVTLEWFKNYLFGRTQLVSMDNMLSEQFPVKCGVPQGSILGPLLFLIFFNDFPDVLEHSDVVQFADDTVIYVASSSFDDIETSLNKDLQRVSKYFRNNELVINLKLGKTECMLFGTDKRLSKVSKPLALFYDHVAIHVTNSYTYLGTIVDSSLTLNDQFDKMYKNASSKLKLLSKLKHYLTDEATKCVFKSIIQPGMRYNCLAFLNLNRTRKEQLNSLDRRAQFLTDLDVNSMNMFYKHAIRIVRKCLDGNLCSNFQNYFNVNIHKKATRNQNFYLMVPKVKLEFAKSSFYFQGVKLFNSLPVEIRRSELEFYSKLKLFQFK